MSLYHQLEQLATGDLEDLAEDYAVQFPGLAEQFAELADARRRTESAVWDQQYRTSADQEALEAGSYADHLTEELETLLLRRYPEVAQSLMKLGSAA